jgi:hypothetical protein
MKIAFETSDFGEALVCRAKLEQAGYLVHMDNYNWGCAEPYLGMALGYRLWVPEGDKEEAVNILQEVTLQLPQYQPNDICPTCDSDNIVRFRSLIWLPVFWLLGVLVPAPSGNKRHCGNCGRTYKNKGPALTGPQKFLIFYILVWTTLTYGIIYRINTQPDIALHDQYYVVWDLFSALWAAIPIVHR